ncbi:MAG: hypothetical protein JWO28_2560 [Hyphomicrobiales bacterium]|nr:hypothetical protein [Hyphomicrobiales bacterium]
MNGFIEGLRSFALPMREASRYRGFSYALLVIAGFLLIFAHPVPTLFAILLAVVICAGSIGFSVPLMWLAGLAGLLAFMAKTGIVLANAGVDRHLHETYYVVQYPRYVLVLLAAVVLIAAVYQLLPRMSGYRYNEYLGMLHVWTTLAGVTWMVAPQFPMMFVPNKLEGIPRRYLDYPEAFVVWNKWYDQWWWDGLFLLALGGLIFVYVLIDTYRRKQPI